jgi:hypothetical protein
MTEEESRNYNQTRTEREAALSRSDVIVKLAAALEQIKASAAEIDDLRKRLFDMTQAKMALTPKTDGHGLALQLSRTEMADLVIVIEHFLACKIITSERRRRCDDLLVTLRRLIEKGKEP